MSSLPFGTAPGPLGRRNRGIATSREPGRGAEDARRGIGCARARARPCRERRLRSPRVPPPCRGMGCGAQRREGARAGGGAAGGLSLTLRDEPRGRRVRLSGLRVAGRPRADSTSTSARTASSTNVACPSNMRVHRGYISGKRGASRSRATSTGRAPHSRSAPRSSRSPLRGANRCLNRRDPDPLPLGRASSVWLRGDVICKRTSRASKPLRRFEHTCQARAHSKRTARLFYALFLRRRRRSGVRPVPARSPGGSRPASFGRCR